MKLARPTNTLVWELDTAGPDTFTVNTGSVDVLVHNADCIAGDRPDPGDYGDPDGIRLENESADLWFEEGHDVEFLADGSHSAPPTNVRGETPPNPNKRPDHLVDGEFHDAYAPASNSAESAVKGAFGKVAQGQAQYVDVNLNRTNLSIDDFAAAMEIPGVRQDIDGDFYHYTNSSGKVFEPIQITVLKGSHRVVVYRN